MRRSLKKKTVSIVPGCAPAASALLAVPPLAAEGAARMVGRAPRPSHLFVLELDPSAALTVCALASALRP